MVVYGNPHSILQIGLKLKREENTRAGVYYICIVQLAMLESNEFHFIEHFLGKKLKDPSLNYTYMSGSL